MLQLHAIIQFYGRNIHVKNYILVLVKFAALKLVRDNGPLLLVPRCILSMH